MSLNSVMLNGGGDPPFIFLPNELLRSGTTSLKFKIANKTHPNRDINAIGKIYLTNQRLVFISSQGDIQSFSILLKQINSHRLHSPWFGPNAWRCGFINKHKNSGLIGDNDLFELDVTFNDGGMYSYVETFNGIYTDALNEVDELPQYSP